MLASLLDTNDIRHAWQGTTVTVLEEDEARVDALIDDVLASARPALDPTAEKVVYEVGVWPAALQTSLADALTVADLPYEWDERGDLVIYAEHEEEVEVILDELPDPDDPELDGLEDGVASLSSDDGLAVHELLDQLFVGSDRLARHPTDAGSIVRVDEAVGDLERMPPPFGFEPGQWRTLVTRAVRCATPSRPRPAPRTRSPTPSCRRWPARSGTWSASTSERRHGPEAPTRGSRRPGGTLSWCSWPRWRRSTPDRSPPPGGSPWVG